jgi:hypothetical protein
VGLAALVLQGAARFEAVSDLLAGGLQLLALQWRFTAPQSDQVLHKLRALVGFPAIFGPGAAPRPGAVEDPAARTRFPHTAVLFSAALAAGWPWSLALHLFAGVIDGSFCNRGHGFITSYGLRLSPELLHGGRTLTPWQVLWGTPGSASSAPSRPYASITADSSRRPSSVHRGSMPVPLTVARCQHCRLSLLAQHGCTVSIAGSTRLHGRTARRRALTHALGVASSQP